MPGKPHNHRWFKSSVTDITKPTKKTTELKNKLRDLRESLEQKKKNLKDIKKQYGGTTDTISDSAIKTGVQEILFLPFWYYLDIMLVFVMTEKKDIMPISEDFIRPMGLGMATAVSLALIVLHGKKIQNQYRHLLQDIAAIESQIDKLENQRKGRPLIVEEKAHSPSTLGTLGY